MEAKLLIVIVGTLVINKLIMYLIRLYKSIKKHNYLEKISYEVAKSNIEEFEKFCIEVDNSTDTFEERMFIIQKILDNRNTYYKEYGYILTKIDRSIIYQGIEIFEYEIKSYSFWRLVKLWISSRK